MNLPVVYFIQNSMSQLIKIGSRPAAAGCPPAQVATQADMALAGIRCRVARSVDEVEEILRIEGVRLHARTGFAQIRKSVPA